MTAFVFLISIHTVTSVYNVSPANLCWLGFQQWVFYLKPFDIKSNLLPTSISMWTWKKEKVVPQGKATDCPNPPRDAWLRRMAVSAANLQPVTGPTSKKKPPAGRHRWDEAESRPSSPRFIDSFRPGAVTHNRSPGEIDNPFMRNVTLRLRLLGAGWASSHCTNTLTLELKKAGRGGMKSNKIAEGSPLSKKKKTQVPEKRWMDERLGGVWGEGHESETDLVRGW